MLRFRDLEIKAGFAEPGATRYRYRLTHNACKGTGVLSDQETAGANAEGSSIPLGEVAAAAMRALQDADSGADCDRYFYLTLWTRRADDKGWGKWVKVHLYHADDQTGLALVAVEREE